MGNIYIVRRSEIVEIGRTQETVAFGHNFKHTNRTQDSIEIVARHLWRHLLLLRFVLLVLKAVLLILFTLLLLLRDYLARFGYHDGCGSCCDCCGFFSFFSFAFAAWNKLAAHATGEECSQRAIGSGAEIAFRLRFRCAPGIVRNGLPFAIFLLIIRFCGTVFRHCLLHFRQRVRRFGLRHRFSLILHGSGRCSHCFFGAFLRRTTATFAFNNNRCSFCGAAVGFCVLLHRGAFGCCFLCDVFFWRRLFGYGFLFLAAAFFRLLIGLRRFGTFFLFGSGSSRTVDSLLIEDSVDKFFFFV